jgi:hypothetical protein
VISAYSAWLPSSPSAEGSASATTETFSGREACRRHRDLGGYRRNWLRHRARSGRVLLTFFEWASVLGERPVRVAGLVGTAVAVRESRNPRSGRLDAPGVTASAIGLVAATLGLIESAAHS